MSETIWIMDSELEESEACDCERCHTLTHWEC